MNKCQHGTKGGCLICQRSLASRIERAKEALNTAIDCMESINEAMETPSVHNGGRSFFEENIEPLDVVCRNLGYYEENPDYLIFNQ